MTKGKFEKYDQYGAEGQIENSSHLQKEVKQETCENGSIGCKLEGKHKNCWIA